jgi:hypothetical protein
VPHSKKVPHLNYTLKIYSFSYNIRRINLMMKARRMTLMGYVARMRQVNVYKTYCRRPKERRPQIFYSVKILSGGRMELWFQYKRGKPCISWATVSFTTNITAWN